jgi:hypothetical protein
VPTLILSAEDDPFVPPDPFSDPSVVGTDAISVQVTREGGHCGFVSDTRSYDYDGYWAERRVVEFVKGKMGGEEGESGES